MPSEPSAPPHDPRSPIRFPAELPISGRVREIAAAIHEHPVVIVAGATGSGKTTQLPKIALAMGRGVQKLIGVTQPRRIAATSVAARVAREIGSPLGTDVGYQIRFEERTSPATYVKFMTDGILLAEIQADRLLHRYDTLIIDEAHERSLNIDFLLGWLRRILPERPDLKVVVSSATLEIERFSAFFGGAPIVQVEGRTFPVDVLYEPPPEDVDLAQAAADAVANVASLDPRGDILVFLPGEREIRETESELRSRGLRHTVILPLYARLAAADQSKVFASVPERRVILATNVAETSLTIPGVVYVVDTGVARLSRYDPRSGTTRLQVEGISQASADQRKGRCGRVRDGICIRLYPEESFAARPAFTDPEIKRMGLASVILRMKAQALGDVEDFPFIDPPSGRSVTEGYRVLEELGALGPGRELTPLGEKLARFPVDPRIGRMVLAGAELGCLPEVLVVAAGLNVQDPRERPRELEQKADALHAPFRDDRSDFVGMLRLWRFVEEAESKSTSHLRRTCKDTFLSFARVREWREIHRQLTDVVRDVGIAVARHPGRDPASTDTDALHRALLTGLLSKIGHYHQEHRVYLGARQTRFTIHPSSPLARRQPVWIMAFELVETTQLFARTVAKIEPEWLLAAAPHLLKRSYSDPHWSEKSARASVREHASLFGLPVARDRSVDYATVAPDRARAMFIEHALVRGEFQTRGAFAEKNRKLLAEVARLRDKARRSDMLADDGALHAFFDRRIPTDVRNGTEFEAWRESAERQDPGVLVLGLDDVLAGDPCLVPEHYPDVLTLHGVELPLAYRFDPSADDDGVTISVPLVVVAQIDPGELDWTIPGLLHEKIVALLHELPRHLRRDLGPVPELAQRLAGRLVPFEGPMIPALARALADESCVEVSEDAFRPDAVPPYLRFTCRLIGEHGKAIAQGRDVASLWSEHAARARAAWTEGDSESRWERKGLKTWDFGDLPRFVTRRVSGTTVRAHPSLVDRGATVDLVLLESAAAAEVAMRAGTRRLLANAASGILSAFSPRVPGPFPPPSGEPPSRAQQDAFRARAILRIVEHAFDLDGDAALPRSKREFEALVARGAPRIESSFRLVAELVQGVCRELESTLRALRSASKHPTAKGAITEIRAHLERLFPEDLIAWIPLERLQHVPRYVRATQARLERAIADPRKDAEKLSRIQPAWTAFLEKERTARDRQAALALRWSFEELRVAVFAPELKTAIAVSPGALSAEVASLR